jgi:hypothetical protein
MGALLTALLEFITPVVIFFASIGTVVAFLLGALANPQGWMNSVICTAIDYIASIFPSTPDDMKIGTVVSTLINGLGSSIPIVGVGIIREIFTTFLTIAGLALAIKIYKLLPFKAT